MPVSYVVSTLEWQFQVFLTPLKFQSYFSAHYWIQAEASDSRLFVLKYEQKPNEQSFYFAVVPNVDNICTLQATLCDWWLSPWGTVELERWFSKHGPLDNITFILKLASNAKTRAPPQTCWIRSSGDRAQESVV